jgi:hypothetical protein
MEASGVEAGAEVWREKEKCSIPPHSVFFIHNKLTFSPP